MAQARRRKFNATDHGLRADIDDLDEAGDLVGDPDLLAVGVAARRRGRDAVMISFTTVFAVTSMTWTRSAASEATKTKRPPTVASTPTPARRRRDSGR